MSEFDCQRMLASLPAGLTFIEVSRRLGIDYNAARYAIQKHGYKAADGRRFCQNAKRKLPLARIDWTKPNVEIARQFGVSRERVRVLRLPRSPVL